MAFEFRLQQIAWLEVQFSPDTVGDNNLPFR